MRESGAGQSVRNFGRVQDAVEIPDLVGTNEKKVYRTGIPFPRDVSY